MKLHHEVRAPAGLGVVATVVGPGDQVAEGDVLVRFRATVTAPSGAGDDLPAPPGDPGPGAGGRSDLAEVAARHAATRDGARPDAVAKRRARGQRTARENVADLVDDDTFVEYGPLAVAAQRRRRSDEDLRRTTPADGVLCGVARVNGDAFPDERADVAVLAYDASVLAGTQGMRGHAKQDRLLDVAGRRHLPVVCFPEGGGGRPGDVDAPTVSGLEVTTFHAFGALRGRVPLIGVVSGRCFAGNAALAGLCDVLIATPGTNLGMGGPAMIEGGGLGSYTPEDIGPLDVQVANGVVDLVADDEAAAVDLARRCLAYAQGALDRWETPDPDLARAAVPERRTVAYAVRDAVAAVADRGSVLELRPAHAGTIVTCLVRVEGHPFGVVANDPHHLGGAIDVAGARKLAEFLELCQAWRLPVVSLCDTPGFMVGPASEEEGAVRACSRLFAVGAHLTVPLGAVILRKGYGLGAQAMVGGSFRAPEFVVAWPTGEIGGMGLEGAVRLGFRKELEAVEDPAERARTEEALIAAAYEQGRALHVASQFELDDVIDPADTRRWILTLLARRPERPDRP
jgi:acetyl-CoA carboxylase carboxyltransferase component